MDLYPPFQRPVHLYQRCRTHLRNDLQLARKKCQGNLKYAFKFFTFPPLFLHISSSVLSLSHPILCIIPFFLLPPPPPNWYCYLFISLLVSQYSQTELGIGMICFWVLFCIAVSICASVESDFLLYSMTWRENWKEHLVFRMILKNIALLLCMH